MTDVVGTICGGMAFRRIGSENDDGFVWTAIYPRFAAIMVEEGLLLDEYT